jgi:hypothetical protein
LPQLPQNGAPRSLGVIRFEEPQFGQTIEVTGFDAAASGGAAPDPVAWSWWPGVVIAGGA